MPEIWFTGDTHFGHENIIKYCNRPFKTLEEHDEALISLWNQWVGKDDTVYHLGDFAWWRGDPNRPREIVRMLNGHIHIVPGNHDPKPRSVMAGWGLLVLPEQVEIEPRDECIVLNHYAMRVWNKSHHGSWQLYGHSHGTLEDDPTLRAFDVGVDCHNYHPINYDAVREIMAKKKWVKPF